MSTDYCCIRDFVLVCSVDGLSTLTSSCVRQLKGDHTLVNVWETEGNGTLVASSTVTLLGSSTRSISVMTVSSGLQVHPLWQIGWADSDTTTLLPRPPALTKGIAIHS